MMVNPRRVMVLSSSGLVWRSKLSVFEFEHELRAQFARFATAMAPAEKGFVDASLEELNEELSSMRMQFDRWAEAREQGVLDIKANHDEKFQEVKGAKRGIVVDGTADFARKRKK